MPEFRYRAADRQGALREGQLRADSADAALRQLRQQGLTPIGLTEGGSSSATASSGALVQTTSRPRRARRPGAEDVLAMTNELTVLLRAGLPLDRAFKVMIGMNANPAMTEVLAQILDAVKGGKGLSQALRPHVALFGEFYINMVRSGEAGGRLGEVLARLGEHLERSRALRQSVISALIYPSILIVVAILSVFLMLGFVVPQFETLFADMGQALPLPTRIVVGAGHAVADYGVFGLMLAAVVWFFWKRWLVTTAGRNWRDRQILRLPVLGAVLTKYEITRFSRTLGTLLGSGVSMLESISIALDTIGNIHVRQALVGLTGAVKQGGRLATELEKSGVFTPMATHMVMIGEETGRVDSMLLELARVYDDEVQAGVKRALTLLEPVLILVLGVVIAAIIISILMGILSVNDLAV